MANEDNNLLASLFAGVADNRGPADLSQFENTISRNNLYRQASIPVLNTRFNTATWNPGTTLGVSFAQGFLGSALNALGARSEATQLAAANKVMPQLALDPLNTPVPEGVDDLAFEQLRAQKIQQKALREANIADSLQSSLGQRLIKYDPSTGSVSTLPGAESLAAQLFGRGEAKNPELEKQAIKEAMTKADLDQSLSYISDSFKRAKDLTGAKAAAYSVLGLPNQKGQELEGMGASITYQIDKTIKKELNGDVRKQFLTLAPKWYDSNDTLDVKEAAMKKLLKSLSEAPVLSNVTAPSDSTAPSSPTQNIPPGMKLQRNKTTGETRLVPQ